MDIAQQPVPSVVAMLLCDSVITEAATNKKTLVGIFDHWNLVSIPSRVSFWVYARLTDAEGPYIFSFRFVYLDKDLFLAEARTKEVQATDRLGFCDLVLQVPYLELPEVGRYEVQLYANDVYVGRTTMLVKLKQGG